MTGSDPRIPVYFGAALDVAPGVALLVEGDTPVPPGAAVARFAPRATLGHAVGCPCCAPRGPVAEALGRLFLAHMRGRSAPLRAIVAVTCSEAGHDAVRAALRADPLSRARFRLL
ncbi:MAG TPA: hypothetical protein VJ779_04015 [Acetobacteraceae bacterium]|nr:hypothetical protein [Acetobacteraceae bacterium]